MPMKFLKILVHLIQFGSNVFSVFLCALLTTIVSILGLCSELLIFF